MHCKACGWRRRTIDGAGGKKNVNVGLNLVEQFNVGCDLAQNSRDSVSVSLVPQGLAISRYCNSL